MDKELLARLDFVVERPFQRITYSDAVDLLKKSGEKFEFPIDYGLNLQSEHERWLTEKHFKCPVTVFNFPKEIKPFYMRLNDDGKTVAAMDLLVPGIGEIVGGSQREERLEMLEENMRAAQHGPRRLQMVSRSSALRHGATLRLRPRLRTDADVHHRRSEHPRRHSLSRARPAAPSSDGRAPRGASGWHSCAELPSALRLSYSRELQLGTARLLENELVAGNFHLINCRSEWRFDFDPVLIAELVSAANLSDKHRPVTRKFPDRLVFGS